MFSFLSNNLVCFAKVPWQIMATSTSLLCFNYNSPALAQLNSELTNQLGSHNSDLLAKTATQSPIQAATVKRSKTKRSRAE